MSSVNFSTTSIFSCFCPTYLCTKAWELAKKVGVLAKTLFSAVTNAAYSGINSILFTLKINVPNRKTLMDLIQKPDVTPQKIESLVKRHPGESKKVLFTGIPDQSGIYESPLSLLLKQKHLTADLLESLLNAAGAENSHEFFKYDKNAAHEGRSPLHIFFKNCQKETFEAGEVARLIELIIMASPDDNRGLFHPSLLALLIQGPALQLGAFKAIVKNCPKEQDAALFAPYENKSLLEYFRQKSKDFELAKELWKCCRKKLRENLCFSTDGSIDPLCLKLMNYEINGTLPRKGIQHINTVE